MIGLFGLVLPLFGIQFTVVTFVADVLNVSSLVASGLLIAIGFAITVAGPIFSGIRDLALVILGQDATTRTPRFEELDQFREPGLSDDAFQRLYPFYQELRQRSRYEHLHDLHKDIARKAQVTEDDVRLYHLACMAMRDHWRSQ